MNSAALETGQLRHKSDKTYSREGGVNTTDALLKGILATVGRRAFPPDALYKSVAPTAGSDKQLAAYKMCDGQAAQSGIGKRLKIDPGNLSRLMGKWAEAGILIRVGTEEFPLHLYPLARPSTKTTKKAT
jgi:hypothetical protein